MGIEFFIRARIAGARVERMARQDGKRRDRPAGVARASALQLGRPLRPIFRRDGAQGGVSNAELRAEQGAKPSGGRSNRFSLSSGLSAFSPEPPVAIRRDEIIVNE